MKHIFKKLHHHPNRSNENPQSPSTPSPSCSENRTNPFSSSSSSSPAASITPASTTTAATTGAIDEGNSLQPHYTHQDFISSEEEYQYQLALAISASSSGRDTAVVDSRKVPIRSTDNGKAAADLMSRRYWDFGILDFEERIVDGFYDVHSLSSDPTDRENMPSLADIESNTGVSYEVVIVNRMIDPALEELMQIAHCIVLDCPTTEMLIERLSELVTKHLGGPVRDANIILAKFMERSMELRSSLHTVVLPIGSLRIGLSRHRALLFKALADSIGIHCRLVKGSHYTGMEDDAVNIVKLHDGSECLVDLMGSPGSLIPADTSGKDIPYSYNPETSSQSCPQTTNSTNVTPAQPQFNSVSGYNSAVGTTSWKPGSLLPNRSANDGVGTSGHSEKVTFNQLDHSPPEGIERSSFYKGGRGPNLPGDGMRLNLNMTPYSSKSPEDPKSMFSELNPFQNKESGKPLLQNGLVNEVGKLQFLKGNSAAGLSPAPLLWKNRQACNELSKENNKGDVGASLLKNIRAAINSNALTVSRSSEVLPEMTCSSHPPFSNSNFALEEIGPGQLSWENISCSSDTKMLSLEDVNIVKGECKSDDHQNGVTIVHKDNKNVQDRLIGMAAKSLESEATSSHGLHANFVDTEIDDVGECEIVWEDLVLGERIGLGSYGEVYRADWNGTEVAVKKFLDQDFSGAALDEFKREVRIMRRLRHPNVVLFMGAVTRPPNLSIITEFLPRGSLYRIIHRPHGQIDEKRRIKMALDVAKGMNCLHTSTPTIVHRDLKSPNLLVDHNWNVKVCDFGLSRLKHNTFLSSKSTGGTPEWMAPEVLRNEPSNEKCDVYSFGVILWELATLKLPWSGMNPMQVVGAVGFQNRRLDIRKEVDPLVARIIWKCWETDPNQRPSFAQLSRALKPLQRLAVPSHVEPQTTSLSQEITVNSTQEMHLFS